MKKYQPMKPITITAIATTVIITGLLTSWLPTPITSLPFQAFGHSGVRTGLS
jgi:hypothetical protein